VEDLAILLYGHHVCTPGAPQTLTPPTSWSYHDAIAPNYEGDTTVGNLLFFFIMSSCGERCQMTSMITQSKNVVYTMVQDGLTTVTRGRLGIRYQHELLFRNTIRQWFLTWQRFFDRSNRKTGNHIVVQMVWITERYYMRLIIHWTS